MLRTFRIYIPLHGHFLEHLFFRIQNFFFDFIYSKLEKKTFASSSQQKFAFFAVFIFGSF